MKINLTHIVSNIDRSMSFEWIANNLDKDKFNLSFVLMNPCDSGLEIYLKSIGIRVERIHYKSKFDLPLTIFKLILFFLKNQTTIVHCHLFDASLAGLFAAKLCFIKKRIYTRHHSNFHHKYYPSAVYYDKMINFLATDIISISKVVSKVLMELENVDEKKVKLIYHGFDLNMFSNSISTEMQVKYNLVGDFPIIGVISRYTDLKGVQFIIPAFKDILAVYPNAKLVLANAKGCYDSEIKHQLAQLPTESYVEIVFEPQINLLYTVFDIYVHTPIDEEVEAFGQTYVEALASGIPSIFTLSGIANEFIVNEENALVVDYKNSDEIFKAVLRLLNISLLRNKLIEKGKLSVNRFDLKVFIFHLENLYLN